VPQGFGEEPRYWVVFGAQSAQWLAEHWAIGATGRTAEGDEGHVDLMKRYIEMRAK